MKHLCCGKILVIFLLCVTDLFGAPVKKSAIVYYGDDVSYSLVGNYDYIILEPEYIDTATHGFKLYSNAIYGYVSVGEQESKEVLSQIKPKWIAGENTLWKSKIMDINNSDYRDFLIQKVIDPMVKKGIKNLFLDTLDSYHQVAKSPEAKIQMKQATVDFIKSLHLQYPDMKLILNRGFELIDEVHPYIEAVLFESYFYGLSPKDLSYKEVSKEDREWLKIQIDKIKSYHKDVIALDYLPPENKALREQAIKQIEAQGMIPYIAEPTLQQFGLSSISPIKREVLILYDDAKLDKKAGDTVITLMVFRILAMPLEYMGYIPIFEPLSTWKYTPSDSSRYNSAVVWSEENYPLEHPKPFESTIDALIESGMKFLIIDSLASEKHPNIFNKLHIKVKESSAGKVKKTIVCKAGFAGFEADPIAEYSNDIFTPQNANPLCNIKGAGESSTVVAITQWGGYILNSTFVLQINQKELLTLNPFKILQETLRLQALPIPDPTTENGRRLLFSHIDGDGIVSRAEWDSSLFAGEVLYSEIFTQYPIPISASIIEGETAPYGIYPKDSQKAEQIVRQIYTLPNIEAASHTFSHPFFWRHVHNGTLDSHAHLPIKEYRFSVTREINGSLTYINHLQDSKRKPAKTIFWSGDCRPTQEVLHYMYHQNILQINGGDTTITNREPWLSKVAPFGRKTGAYWQIFTGAQNENVFTNDWLGPFWGYKQVIQTFKLTETPRRLKPIDIYYHMYSGSKKSSLTAIKQVYGWALSQETMPIFTSEYIPKVMDFYEVAIAKTSNGWKIKGMDTLKTLRLSTGMFVDLNGSSHIVGYKETSSGLYLHLDTNSTATIVTAPKLRIQSGLIDANIALRQFHQEGKNRLFSFGGHVPAQLRFCLTDDCKLDATPKPDTLQNENNHTVLITYHTIKDANVSLICNQ